jgi:type VI secretion system protein ImpM
MSTITALHLRNPSSIYFGKIQSRGDFVKSTTGTKVIALIDNWVAQGMELLLAEPGWKNYYDAAGPIDFLFIATHKKHTICGALIPSGDASSRRFPFISATLFEIDESLNFLPFSQVVLEKHLNHQRALIQHAAKAHDAADVLATLSELSIEEMLDFDKSSSNYRQFLANTTLAALTQMLDLENDQATVRQMILAIGYLLQPVLTNYMIPPQKGLTLPIPRDPARVSLVKAFWLDLVCTFLPRAEFELSVFSCIHHGSPKLIMTFNGAPPEIFSALFDEQAAQQHLIDISQSTWVEEYAMQDLATLKLSSYLEHGDLFLQQLIETFRQAFSGK